MLHFNDFVFMAKKLNEINRGKFTEEEVLDNANMLYLDYRYSINDKKPTSTMISFCTEIVLDMDFRDYEDLDNTLDIDTMIKIIKIFNEEVQ